MKCIFCGSESKEAKGTILIRKTGKIQYFCSSKCENNALKLKRNPAKLKWAKKKL